MSHHTQIDDKIGGADNFRAWKCRISLILEENDLDKYISGEVLAPKGDEAKCIHKKNLVKAKRIIADSIKDHLIPHVSSLKTPKEVFDALMKLMTLRNYMKNVKIQNLETMQSYFTGVSQIKEQLKVFEETIEGDTNT